MQGLIYIFIALCGIGLSVAFWFLLGLTVIEAGLLALVLILGGALIEECAARRRAFSRLEHGVDEMGRLLKTDARAGQVLSQRVNALVDLDLGARIEVVEADMSVLGTVMRQVAEAVSELEATQARSAVPDRSLTDDHLPPAPAANRPPAEPFPLAEARRAVEEGRLVHHARPILVLPQRKLHAHRLVPRIPLGGRLLDLPIEGLDDAALAVRIEHLALIEALRAARNAGRRGAPARLFVDLSPATLADRTAREHMAALLAADRALAPDLAFCLAYETYATLSPPQAEALHALVGEGAGIALFDTPTLRLDFAALSAAGVRHVAVTAKTFLSAPGTLTDFHSADVNDYIYRFGIGLIVTDLAAESDILSLLDDGVGLAMGDALGPIAPLPAQLAEREDPKPADPEPGEGQPRRAARR